ncbi:MAG: hypothetical protein IPP91_19115 [Betaproteobacteria bacterium]|nr:hypothetical protein [Betaproteobacteria bacterium]
MNFRNQVSRAGSRGRRPLPAFAGLEPLPFDLQCDPHRLRNVAEDPAHREASLRYARRMLSWRLRHADRTLTGYGIGAGRLTEAR